MRAIGYMLVTGILLSTIGANSLAQGGSSQKTQGSPESVVAALYKAHDGHHSPFFQTKSRALVDKYFAPSLANLIWKDARSSKGEVGALDGDPLYDAQDIEIKDFKISPVQGTSGPASKAKVAITFTNFGEKKNFVVLLTSLNSSWKITDIEYGDGQHLAGLLSGH